LLYLIFVAAESLTDFQILQNDSFFYLYTARLFQVAASYSY